MGHRHFFHNYFRKAELANNIRSYRTPNHSLALDRSAEDRVTHNRRSEGCSLVSAYRAFRYALCVKDSSA
jgi:hypothetical protein